MICESFAENEEVEDRGEIHHLSIVDNTGIILAADNAEDAHTVGHLTVALQVLDFLRQFSSSNARLVRLERLWQLVQHQQKRLKLLILRDLLELAQ